MVRIIKVKSGKSGIVQRNGGLVGKERVSDGRILARSIWFAM